MELVVAGLGRTGTNSLARAVRILGFTPVSQEELIQDADRLLAALAMARGEQPFDPQLCEGATASIGWPMCWTWAEQLEHWPQARCLLNVRDPDQWFDSVARAWPFLSTVRKLPFPPKVKLVDGMLGLLEEKMGGPLERELWTAGYRRHIEEVRAGVDPDRLLVWEVGEGWEPICAFLDRTPPEQDFPRGNSSRTDEFAQKVKKLLWS